MPQTRIEVLSPLVSSTHEEAVLLREFAAAHNLRSLLFVTSAYHSRRALWTLRRVFEGSGVEIGLDFVPAGQMQTPGPFSWWLHLRGWQMVAVEYIKFVYYWAQYR